MMSEKIVLKDGKEFYFSLWWNIQPPSLNKKNHVKTPKINALRAKFWSISCWEKQGSCEKSGWINNDFWPENILLESYKVKVAYSQGLGNSNSAQHCLQQGHTQKDPNVQTHTQTHTYKDTHKVRIHYLTSSGTGYDRMWDRYWPVVKNSSCCPSCIKCFRDGGAKSTLSLLEEILDRYLDKAFYSLRIKCEYSSQKLLFQQPSLSVKIRQNPSLSVIIHHYLSLSVIIRLYPSSSVFICLYPSSSVFIYLYPSFLIS